MLPGALGFAEFFIQPYGAFAFQKTNYAGNTILGGILKQRCT
jgi:hypothetical protein